MDDRPLATRPIRHDDYLPLEASDMAGDSASMEPKYRYYVSGSSNLNIGTFGRECQAIYVLGKVQVAVEDDDFGEANLMELGRETQGLLSTVMNQTDGRWGHYSGAIMSLIVYVYSPSPVWVF